MNMEGVFWVIGHLSTLTPVSSMVITNVLSETSRFDPRDTELRGTKDQLVLLPHFTKK